jgi:hypothetical protein
MGQSRDDHLVNVDLSRMFWWAGAGRCLSLCSVGHYAVRLGSGSVVRLHRRSNDRHDVRHPALPWGDM